MDSFELKDFNKRIKLNTDLKNISKVICDKYELGDFASNELIEIGYEDYNYYLTTSKGKYCVKIFSKIRTNEDIKNYLNRIRAVAKSEISSPKPLLLNDDIVFELDYENNHYDICVFEYIDGKNYFEINEKPDNDVLREIAKQTALINNLDIKPEFIYDTWAIVNFKEEYEKKRQYLSDEYKTEFDKLLNEFENIDLERLPKAFVHGDIISTNVMLDKNKKVWIIDFAVSNYLPRIIDLAVTSCNMCLQEDSKEKTYENIEVLLQEYNKYNKLTDYELEMFEVYFRLANAMHILQPNYIIQTDGDSEENQYWLNEGITGYSYSDKEEFNKIMEKLK
jgi:Ser/Thr protein kinase RdoA (MazF antagonist)